ncbi:hypothetical protein BJY04DRAFT_216730 [Aspergillus karnatakaensis]|uniref:DUF5321 domain-containing protein n=1 Tax=Aspergillus karnatakaensis TaxID=1810916 RepID=UPI003CCCC504
MNPTRLRTNLPLRSIPRPRASLANRSQPQPQAPPHTLYTTQRTYSSRTPSLPKIASPSFWSSMMPKFLRSRFSRSPSSSSPSSHATKPKSTEWNPASFYIVIFILIGSQAIRMIALKNEYTAYTRSTEAKIRLLREVIEKVKSGEDVDVEKLLGKGDEGVEREWEEVLREIEQEDSLWHQKQKAKRDKLEEEERAEAAKLEEQKQAQAQAAAKEASRSDDLAIDAQPKRRAGFF